MAINSDFFDLYNRSKVAISCSLPMMLGYFMALLFAGGKSTKKNGNGQKSSLKISEKEKFFPNSADF